MATATRWMPGRTAPLTATDPDAAAGSAPEYRAVPAPRRGLKVRGARGDEARFAAAVEAEINRLSREGWDYVRSDTLPSEERQGWFGGRVTVFRTLLIFRRARPRAPEAVAPPMPPPAPAAAPPTAVPPAPSIPLGTPAAPLAPPPATLPPPAPRALRPDPVEEKPLALPEPIRAGSRAEAVARALAASKAADRDVP